MLNVLRSWVGSVVTRNILLPIAAASIAQGPTLSLLAKVIGAAFSWALAPRTKVVPRVCFTTGFEIALPLIPETTTMTGPAKNRLNDYEAGWLTLLLKMGVASEKALQEAQNRVAQAAINEMNERRERRERLRRLE